MTTGKALGLWFRGFALLASVALLAAGLFPGCASAPSKPKFEGSLREVLVKGSPWIVNWDTGGGRGRFNQTFTENADGSLTAKSDEVGPYETIVRFSEDGKSATWISPHHRVVTLTLDRGEPTGEGGGVKLYFTSGSK
jgi:hypothetical protein